MKHSYTPPFNITPAIVSLVADISQAAGRLSAVRNSKDKLRLRRINRIRTIQGSLAIEGNTLSEKQISAILEGKKVIAPPREIREVRNAIKVYDNLGKLDPYSMSGLLEAHCILMTGLIDVPGSFRAKGAGVMAGKTLVHMAPPADRVPYLVKELLHWLRSTEHHPLIAGSVFHYELEFIHPFEDGNGRMGRLWQSLILSKWNKIFTSIPVESIVHKHQTEYYAALNKSTEKADSSIFIEFMLKMISETINNLQTPGVAPEATPGVRKMLSLMKTEMSRREIQEQLELKDEKHFREKYLRPALALGLIEMSVPDKPNSRFQKYRISRTGKRKI